MDEVVNALLRALSFGTPILLACLGAIVNERAGVSNLGVEGMMAVGALAAFATANSTGNPWLAVLAAVAGAAALALVHAVATIPLRANQFVSGLALTLLGIGLAGLLGKPYEGSPLPVRVPEWPFIVLAAVLTVGLALILSTTRLGLILRSTGENPAAVDALGISVPRVRFLAVLIGGALSGLGGAFLGLAYRPSWMDNITGGLGWLAVALVIFVAWSPVRAALGALFFGVLYYLQFSLQGRTVFPTELLSAMPFVLVLVALGVAGARRAAGHAPAALGRPYLRGER
ncbi:sugar ABC transporter permease (plasmid) [Deinococcus aetherius]|uniref:Sugar ABC transporter permease n=1 Tax=Deinococcus aetherius TaxID=200252 RepID=A0ABN6RN61_9DEIO|nr:ABC transporter permease [Deinococcus aetherius]BDP44280.1 sugar ABC transporter permease [Deinococcus aetherius]